MLRKFLIAGNTVALLCTTTAMAQQTQPNQPQQPTSSVYSRMRRLPPQQNSSGNQQPTMQSQQFPNPQQFPPEQQGATVPGQRPPMSFPHATAPPPTQPVPQQPLPQNGQPTQVQQNTTSNAPETPSGLALKPANPPRVTYSANQLTVIADNSSLAAILAAVERSIGAHVEGASPDSERVFGQFGPGTPRQVLNLLLTGSHYDFILVGAIDDPGGVQRIMLSQHGASPLGISQASNKTEARQNVPAQAQEEEEANEVVTPAPVPEPQPAPQVNQAEQQQQPNQPQVKTPEQLLQELQRLRQQQQQTNQSPR